MYGLEQLVQLLLGGLCLIVLAVIAVRFFAALKTSRWTQTQATILTSESRALRQGESGPETIPHIVYEYTAGGRTYRSHQLKARHVPLGQSDLPHFLNLYPAGSSAPVYYDPANPKEAVLEREPLYLTAERLGCLAAFVATVLLALAYGLKPLHGLVQRWFPNTENEDVLVIATGLGVYLILFGLVWLRQGMKERHWPVVTGSVVSSATGSFRTPSGGSKVPVTMYQASVFYTYEVEGRHYQSNQVRREKTAGSEASAQANAAKYPIGSSVRVYYNPANPADAVLETSPVFGFIVLWAMALLMFAFAASVSGYFRHVPSH